MYDVRIYEPFADLDTTVKSSVNPVDGEITQSTVAQEST